MLVDGCFRAYWKLEEETLTIDRFTPHPDDPPGTADEIAAEAGRLSSFILPNAGAGQGEADRLELGEGRGVAKGAREARPTKR